MNAISAEKRSLDANKKNWTKLKSDAKQVGVTVLQKKRKTGGGQTDEEEMNEESFENFVRLNYQQKDYSVNRAHRLPGN